LQIIAVRYVRPLRSLLCTHKFRIVLCMILKSSYDRLFNDKRLERRGEQLLRSLFKAGSCSIQSIAQTRAEQKSYYRLLRNEKVEEEILIDEIVSRCGRNSNNKVVLSIQDTTEINLDRHRNRIKYDESLGPVNDIVDGIGFKIHPSLVIDAHTYYPYGYSSIGMWARAHQRRSLSEYRHRCLDVSEKETKVWLQSNSDTYKNLSEAKAVIIVQDREGDFYEQFAAAPENDKFHFLIRSNYNRVLEQGVKLLDYINGQPVIGCYKTTITSQRKETRGKRREATVEVKIGKVNLKKPQKKNSSIPSTSILLTVIEAKEVNGNSDDSVLWRLYTTWPVASFEDACQVIEWYGCRWFIEEVFKVLKKECFNIEASELESGWAVRKLSLMMLDTIIKLFQMSIAYGMEEEQMPSTETMFETEEIECLEKINRQVQGSTQKLSNPFNKEKLPWAFWILARIGGWKGYASQRKPGFATLINGTSKFYAIYQGFSLEKDVGTQ
jgi:hypothetical protein